MVPVPLLPPQRLADAVQWSLGFNWKLSYLLALIGLQFAFYGAIGVVAAWVLPPASYSGNFLLQNTALPLFVALMDFVIRSMKLGHLPVWSNTLVPIVSCLSGSAIGVPCCVAAKIGRDTTP